jgi:DNA-binding XRE family transcriptional regulator
MPINTAPPAIIFVNSDIPPQPLSVLVTQLYITEVMTAAIFDGYVAADGYDGYFSHSIHVDGYRLLVLRDLHDLTNRNLADIVLYAKNALVSVEENKYGPPRKTLPISRVYYTNLIFPNIQICFPLFCRPDIYDFFKGHPREAYNRRYNPHRKDPPFAPEPPNL